MNIPENLRYTKDHEWIRLVEEDGTAYIGVTDFAQSELGDIVYVEVDTLDSHVEAEDTFGTIEAVKAASDLFMPLSGDVIEFNDALEDEPELVNSDPYDKGWIVKIKLDDPSSIDTLLDAAGYQALIEG